MPTTSQKKTPDEIETISFDFTSALLDGEAIDVDEAIVTSKNALTDANTTSGIVIGGSKDLDGNVLSIQVQGGAAGEVHTVRFQTGDTNFGNRYETSLNLVIVTMTETDLLLGDRASLKRRLRIDAGDDSENDLLDDLLLFASGYIRSRCQRLFHLDRHVETIRIERHESDDEVFVDEWPLLLVESITFRPHPEGEDEVITDTTRFGFTREGRVFFHDGSTFLQEPGENLIAYRGGFAAIPRDLTELSKNLSAFFYRLVGHEGMQSERLGDYAYVRATLQKQAAGTEVADSLVEGILSRYQRRDLR